MKRILIVGATSAIAEAVARAYATRADRLFLVGSREQQLAAIAADLRLRGAAGVEYGIADLDRVDLHDGILETGRASLDGLDVVLVAHGVLPDQQRCDKSADATLAQFHTNGASQISIALRATQVMARCGAGGVVAVI